MDAGIRERADAYIHARYQHPAWLLLASRRAPLVLSCLQSLFEGSQNGVPFDDALQSLTELLTQHANQTDFEIGAEDRLSLARRELRDWIKRGLVVERDSSLYATDALEAAFRFVDSLDNRIMTSTASRLSVVQREIESVEAALNPDAHSRTAHLRRQIQELERQLAEVDAGRIDILSEPEALERIRDISNLAMSLRADFRRVEDSWRETDRALRHSIVTERNHRGEIVDKLLDSHDRLIDTPEGRVFHGFQQQLSRSVELEDMKRRLRAILKHPFAEIALSPTQHNDLRWLVMRLVKESETVIQARARIERDVKGFLKSGLAAEHHRVGLLLNEVFRHALDIDWTSATVRGKDGPLPPVAFSNSGLPLPERLRFKSLDEQGPAELELSQRVADLGQVEEDFWQSFASLDRQALVRDTLELLKRTGQPLTLVDLARYLPPTHDLETLTVWLAMAREAGTSFDERTEELHVVCLDGPVLRFDVPRVELTAEAMPEIEWEI